jgi:hypothetical protein
MIARMIGEVDGKEIIFKKDGSYWTATVPKDIDGAYVVEIKAYDSAGNMAYSSSMLFFFDPKTLRVELLPLNFAHKIIEDGFKEKITISEFVYSEINARFSGKEIPHDFSFEVVVV